MLVSLIKSKHFDQALDFVKRLPANLQNALKFEHAYVLHRSGNNTDALRVLNSMSAEDKSTFKCQHLLSQVNYKLSEYKKAMATYVNILAESQRGDGERLEADEVSDIIVNYLACQSSTSGECLAEIQKVIGNNKGFDETYEYYFNLSQVYLKEGHVQKSVELLEQAYEKAIKDDAFRDDQVRFKVQEMHFLNEMYS